MKLTEIIKEVIGRTNSDIEFEANEMVDTWESWYKGNVKDFHNYTIYNGRREISMKRYSLNMAKKVCEDWANLLINEKTDITLSDDKSQETLNKILQDCNFWSKANEGEEKTFALGMGAWIVSVDDLSVNEEGQIKQDGKVNVTFVNRKKIIPISYEDNRITECAFVCVNSDRVNVQIHLLNEQGNYEIHSFEATGKDINNLTLDPERYYVFDTKNNLPWFFIRKPNLANNVDINSIMGMSIFANAIDILKEIDLIFDSYANEFALGRKRIFVNARSVTVDIKGEIRETFDSNDVVIYTLPESDDGSMFMQDNTQTLRVADHQAALQNILNLLSYQCGFGTQHYRYDTSGITTATQIISENSDMFRNIRKQEILIEQELTALVKTIIYATNTFTSEIIDENTEIEIKFDDSIIEDKATEIANDRTNVTMGIMSKAEFRSKWFNEDIETAQKHIDEMNSFTIDDNEEI